MKKLNLEIEINTSREDVWNSIVDLNKYKLWTNVFSEGSVFEGGWNTGDTIRFLAENKDNQKNGMLSEIAESRFPEYISIRHLGNIINGVEDIESEEVKRWAPSYENYTLEKLDENKTRFILDMDISEEYYDMFLELWPKALILLKQISEDNKLNPHKITIETTIKAPVEKVWEYWTKPEHVMQWNHASDDWHCPKAENDLRVNGKFCYTMASVNGKMSFDFEGIYKKVEKNLFIHYELADGRNVEISFVKIKNGVKVTETFDAEKINSIELQRNGWQAILDNFRRYVEK